MFIYQSMFKGLYLTRIRYNFKKKQLSIKQTGSCNISVPSRSQITLESEAPSLCCTDSVIARSWGFLWIPSIYYPATFGLSPLIIWLHCSCYCSTRQETRTCSSRLCICCRWLILHWAVSPLCRLLPWNPSPAPASVPTEPGSRTVQPVSHK